MEKSKIWRRIKKIKEIQLSKNECENMWDNTIYKKQKISK